MYTYIKASKKMSKFLILKTISWEVILRAYFLPLKRTYRSEMHGIKPSFFTDFKNSKKKLPTLYQRNNFRFSKIFKKQTLRYLTSI